MRIIVQEKFEKTKLIISLAVMYIELVGPSPQHWLKRVKQRYLKMKWIENFYGFKRNFVSCNWILN